MAVSRFFYLRMSKSASKTYSSSLSLLHFRIRFSSAADSSSSSSSSPPKPTSLSARMSFIFDQIDEIDKNRRDKDQTLQRIRDWRHSKNPPTVLGTDNLESKSSQEEEDDQALSTNEEKKAELVHPWPEWIELMERLVQQNYFDHRRKDEDGMMQGLGLDSDTNPSDNGDGGVSNLMREFKTVQNAVINFGRDRFDILRSLSRQDLQVLVGYGCPSADKRVVFSCKLLRKHVHLDEGDVCSSCSLRSSCEKAYLLTNKEDEARTIDVMRILLAYGFDPIDGSVVNKPLPKMKSVRTIVRKLLHEVVKLSAVPIDPNLPPPVIKKPPPKVKQPPPPPKKRVGRNDVEMKKGDWLCPKCDFLNFAKNTVCLQCDAKRPKRQLLPGEWECPQCNFLNYRRNTVCFHCEHNRPSDTYVENQYPAGQRGPRMKTEKMPNRANVSSAWNFDFDDNESDGADVAAFEYADSQKLDEDFPLGHENPRAHRDGPVMSSADPKRNYSDLGSARPGIGFNDFDEDEDDLDSYELVNQAEAPKTSRINFSELEADSESEDVEITDRHRKTSPRTHSNKKSLRRRGSFSDSEDIEVEFNSDDDLLVHPKWKSSHVADRKQQDRRKAITSFASDEDDDDLGFGSGSDDETLIKSKKGGQSYNRRDRIPRGKSNFESNTDSDDDFGNHRDKQRDKAGRGRPVSASKHHGGKIAQKRSSRNDDFGSSSRPQRNNRGLSENTYSGQGKNGPREGKFSKRASFDKQRGKSFRSDNQFDDYLNDERYRRPRVNVR